MKFLTKPKGSLQGETYFARSFGKNTDKRKIKPIKDKTWFVTQARCSRSKYQSSLISFTCANALVQDIEG